MTQPTTGTSSERRRVDELRELLHQANEAYYVDAQPLMSDRDFDDRLAELVTLEEQHPEWHDPNSPSQRIGGRPIDGFHHRAAHGSHAVNRQHVFRGRSPQLA